MLRRGALGRGIRNSSSLVTLRTGLFACLSVAVIQHSVMEALCGTVKVFDEMLKELGMI